MKFSDSKTDHGHHTRIKFENGVQRDAWFDELNHLQKFTDNRGHSLTRIAKDNKFKTQSGNIASVTNFKLDDDVEYQDDDGIKHTLPWHAEYEFQSYSDLYGKQFKEVYLKNLPRFDKNKNGNIEIAELKSALEDVSIKGYSAEMLYALNKHFFEFASLHTDGKVEQTSISKDDIDEFDRCISKLNNDKLFAQGVDWANKVPFSGLLTSKVPAIQALINEATIVSNIDSELSYGSLKFMDAARPDQGAFGRIKHEYSIVPKACQQSEMGDCAVVSSMAAVAHNNPKLIERMIKENKDGTFDVTLPIEPKKPYHVTLSPTEQVMYEIAGDEGKWPAVLKKAYGMRSMKLDQSDKERMKSTEVPWLMELIRPGTRNAHKLQESASCPADYIGSGNFPEHVIGALTGRPTNSKWCGYTKIQDLDKKLTEIVKQKIPAVAGSNLMVLQNPLNPKFPELFGGHAYTIMNYDSQHKMVELRNPWGHGAQLKDFDNGGIFKMPLDEFKDKFLLLSYTTEKPEWNFDSTAAALSAIDKVIDVLSEDSKSKKKN